MTFSDAGSTGVSSGDCDLYVVLACASEEKPEPEPRPDGTITLTAERVDPDELMVLISAGMLGV